MSTRRDALRALLGGLAALGAARAAGQGAPAAGTLFPARPVRIVAALGAGTSLDTLARLLARGLADVWTEPVIVDNRPGAAGNIASEIVARAAPDGHTLLISSGAVTILPATGSRAAVDPEQALAPVSLLITQPLVVAAHPSFPARDFGEVIRLAREKPGTIAYSTSGIGSNAHLTAEWATTRAGIRLLHVPYTANRALTDVLSGEVPLAFTFAGTAVPMVRSGQLRALAVTSAQRLAALPDVPTLAESGLPDFEVMNWQALFAPAGTPPAIVAQLQRDAARALLTPAVRERLQDLGFTLVGSTPAQLGATVRQEVQRWKKVIADAGLRFDP